MRTGKRTYKEASYKVKLTKRFKGRGYHTYSVTQRFHAGWPDMQVIINGITFYIELKVEPNGPTELQKKTLFKLAEAGAPALIMTRRKDGTELITIYSPHGDCIELERDNDILGELALYFPQVRWEHYSQFANKKFLL